MVKFLFNFNRARLIHENEWLSIENIELFTDSTANSDLGCGAYCHGHWIYWSWPNEWETSVFKAMPFLELVQILLAIHLWGEKCFVNKKNIMLIDNSALVSIVNWQSSKSKRVMMLIRRMVLLLLKYNIMI